jgi:Skp family chaperone for outer membrane proteins
VTADQVAGTRHGNVKGWRRHQRAGERPCDACAKARADYDERRRNSDAETRAARIRGRAQIRAYQRLAHEYPDKYAAYYAEAKEQVADEVAEVVASPPDETGDAP